MLCQSAKVHAMDCRINTFGDYTFHGFKHFVLRQFEGEERVNESVLNGFVAGAVQVGCDFGLGKASDLFIYCPIDGKLPELRVRHVRGDRRELNSSCWRFKWWAVEAVLSAGGCGLGEESTVLAWPRMDRTSPRTVISIACRCSGVSL